MAIIIRQRIMVMVLGLFPLDRSLQLYKVIPILRLLPLPILMVERFLIQVLLLSLYHLAISVLNDLILFL